mmetsp:Transcript_17572/g.29308  ORF Transcript_17572/g.29308 Transcript_17572/m.29308 type:complete len:451 (-) Transcript_17572:65-1417(-)
MFRPRIHTMLQQSEMEGLDCTSAAVSGCGASATSADVATLAASSLTSRITALAAAQTAGAQRQEPSAAAVSNAWDAHLDNPAGMDSQVNMLLWIARRASLGLTSEKTICFAEQCEFVSLGCFCAVSNALQLLALKRFSYPFDWVRSSVEGVMHCLDMEFEDFLTYSTCWATDQYYVFGGTRWGGSFWHHNLEAPITKHDMLRRINRFYGRESVPACKPRCFVRSVNSTREVHAAVRLLDALRKALPNTPNVFLLLILDSQGCEGLMAISGQDGLLFYGITDAETQYNLGQPYQALACCSESYARAIAAAIRYWSGEGNAMALRTFASLKELSGVCMQFDGGDPGRELFTPRKFFGQYVTGSKQMAYHQNLFAQVQSRNFMVPDHYDVKAPYQVEAFGRTLNINLPDVTSGGCYLQLCLNEDVISGMVCRMVDGHACNVAEALVTDVSRIM